MFLIRKLEALVEKSVSAPYDDPWPKAEWVVGAVVVVSVLCLIQGFLLEMARF